MSEADALSFVESLLTWSVIDTTGGMVVRALKRGQRFDISPCDAAILQAAVEAGCTTLLSEDLSAGQNYGGVVVSNPFLEAVSRARISMLFFRARGSREAR